jgi:hypothetical protein
MDFDFDLYSRSYLFPWATTNYYYNLIPIQNANTIDVSNIKNINIIVVSDGDIPRVLSSLKMQYLIKYCKINSISIDKFYRNDSSGSYYLKDALTSNQMAELANYLMSTGKLFAKQNLPLFSSSLQSKKEDRPLVALFSGNNTGLDMLWPNLTPRISNLKVVPPGELYFGIKGGLIQQGGNVYIGAQIEMRDGSVLNQYYSFLSSQ